MKQFKNLLALVLAVMMVIGMMSVASAASITITKDASYSDEGSPNGAYAYKAYKIFDAKYASLSGANTQDNKDTFSYPEDAKVSYFMATGNPWISTVQGMTDYFTVSAAADGSGYTVILKEGVESNDTTAKAIATALNSALETVNPTGVYAGIDVTAGGAAVDVDAGYYLIKSTTASILALVTTDVTLVEKNDYTKLIKELTDETTVGDFEATDDETTSNNDTVQVGDTVSYTLTVYIPVGANQQMVVTDTYTTGLDPVLDGTVVKVTTTGFTGTPTVSAPANGQFTITLSATDVAANAGKTITFVYEAVVTKDAWKANQDNTGKVKYGNDYETQPDKVDSKTYNLTIQKKAESEEGDSLKGAKFELYRTDNAGHALTKEAVNLVALADADLTAGSITKADNTVYYRVADKDDTTTTTTIDMTNAFDAVIYGLDGDSTYYVRETVAPDGYNKLDSDVEVAMNDQNKIQPIVNNAGSVLPSTGGIGTTIFYIAGAVLVLGAAAVVIARRKAEQ